jgi:hypothetical protein
MAEIIGRAPYAVRNIPTQSPAVALGLQARGHGRCPPRRTLTILLPAGGGDRHGRAHDRCRNPRVRRPMAALSAVRSFVSGPLRSS